MVPAAVPDPVSRLAVAATHRDGLAVLTLDGVVDLLTVAELERALDLVVAAGGTAVVDLRQVAFMDSTGLATLLRYAAQARDAPFDLVVVRGSAEVQRLFAMTGVEETLQMLDVPEEAWPRS